MNRTHHARLLAATALMAFASLAQAQYKWIDEKGLMQFSDRAPPPSVPQKNILKAPFGMPSAANISAGQPAAAPASEESKKAPSVAERNADFRKRAKDKEELEQKEQAAEASKAAKAESCDRARNYKQEIDSGVRIGTHDKNGERGFMSDEQRAAEAQRTDKVLAACK